MASISPDIRQRDEGETARKPREWRLRHLVGLAFAAIGMFAVVFWAALGKTPLSGTKVVAVLGFAFVVLANLSLGALASGAVIEHRHRDWSRFRGVDHVVIYAALMSLALVDAGFGWWLFTSDSGGLTRWVFLAVALAAIAGGALWAWPGMPLLRRRDAGSRKSPWALWPQHDEQAGDDETWRLFAPLTALLGAAFGVAAAVGYLGISARQENQAAAAGHPMPTAVTGIHGGYVALGDSYSAGEGLLPFAPGTAAWPGLGPYPGLLHEPPVKIGSLSRSAPILLPKSDMREPGGPHSSSEPGP